RSARSFRFACRMSYHARIRMPLLIVTAITGACGKMNRTGSSFGNPSDGTTCDQPLPSSPRPCIQMTEAFGCGPVSISIASSNSAIATHCGSNDAILTDAAIHTANAGHCIRLALQESPAADGPALDRREHRAIHGHPQQADHDHAEDDLLGALPLHRLHRHVAQAVAACDHFRRDERAPSVRHRRADAEKDL